VGDSRRASDSDSAKALTGPHLAAYASKAPLYVFVAASVLVMNGDTIKFAFLPLYMANQLGISDAMRGAVIAIQPLVELALMPFFARLADRISPIRVVTIGAAFGIAANIAYATSTHVAGLFVGQILMSALWAAVAGLGVTVAQQLYPYGVGLASSVFMSSIMLNGGLGGAIGGLGTALLGSRRSSSSQPPSPRSDPRHGVRRQALQAEQRQLHQRTLRPLTLSETRQYLNEAQSIQCAPTMRLPSQHSAPQRRTEDLTWRRSAVARSCSESSVLGSPHARSPRLNRALPRRHHLLSARSPLRRLVRPRRSTRGHAGRSPASC